MEEFVVFIDENKALPPLVIKSSTDVLREGLGLVYSNTKINRVVGNPYTSSTNIQRFKDHFGANPVVIAKIWEDLQTAPIPEARISHSCSAIYSTRIRRSRIRSAI